MKKVKFSIIFILVFFVFLYVGCNNANTSEIDIYVDELYATSVSFKDDNPGFLYKDKLIIELYKNNELVKESAKLQQKKSRIVIDSYN